MRRSNLPAEHSRTADRMRTESRSPGICAVYSLLICEANDEVRPTIEAALADGRRRGSAFAVAGTLGARAVLALNEGRPADAELDVRTAAASGLPPTLAGVNSAYLVMALTEQGELEGAETALREGGIDAGPGGPTVLRWIPWARARLREIQGRYADVRADVAPMIEDDRAGRGMRSLAWRALLARSLARSGGNEEAVMLATEHLAWAEGWGLPAALGVAHRAAGLAAEGDRADQSPRSRGGDALSVLAPYRGRSGAPRSRGCAPPRWEADRRQARAGDSAGARARMRRPRHGAPGVGGA